MYKLNSKNAMGIYALSRGRTVVYIGQSNNMPMRIGQHIKDGSKQFDGVEMFPVGHKDLLDILECQLILEYMPEYNKQLKNEYLGRHQTLIDNFTRIAHKKYAILINQKFEEE